MTQLGNRGISRNKNMIVLYSGSNWIRTRQNDQNNLGDLQNRRVASRGVTGGFDPHSLPSCKADGSLERNIRPLKPDERYNTLLTRGNPTLISRFTKLLVK